MLELVKLNETDKTKLTKGQKAALARYNFKKNKGEPIPLKGTTAAPPASPESAAPAPPTDIVAQLSPEMQALAGRDPTALSKEEKIALAKAKNQAMRAQAAAGKPAAPAKPQGPTPEELAAQKALGFAHAKELQERFAPALEGWAMQTDKPYAIVKPERVLDVVRYLHMEMGFDQIRDLTAADHPPGWLEVVYNFYRHLDRAHLAVKVKLPRAPPDGDLPSLPSIVPVYAGADWLEREVFDLFGIRFTGHPYLRRIMMPDDWQGYPLRKDYDVKKEQFVGLDEHGNDVVSYDSKMGW